MNAISLSSLCTDRVGLWSKLCPLYPQKRTLEGVTSMSALCQKRTHCSKKRRHSITLSALASIVPGTETPSALAVLRLMFSSYLVGRSTGKSAAFSPLSNLST